MSRTDDMHNRRWTATERGDVVLITHADSDEGYRLALRLLTYGVRVVVTAPTPAPLARILHGNKNSEVMAIAADVDDSGQRARVFERAEARLGRIVAVVDGNELRPFDMHQRAA
jgi:NAD(P)-dependent dehydrogenase (short-subunit alcohol dehydrogenase family)